MNALLMEGESISFLKNPGAGKMAEMALLVPEWQIQALEEAACREGISMGHFMRRLLDRALSRPALSCIDK